MVFGHLLTICESLPFCWPPGNQEMGMYVTIKLSSDPFQGHGFVSLCSPGTQLALAPTPHPLTPLVSVSAGPIRVPRVSSTRAIPHGD